MSIIQNYKSSGDLVIYQNYRSGSLLDYSGYGNHAAVVSTPTWSRAKFGHALQFYGASMLRVTDASSFRLGGSDATFIVFGDFTKQIEWMRVFGKRDVAGVSYELYLKPAGLQLYDGTNDSAMSGSIVGRKLLCVVHTNGSKPKLYLDGTYASLGGSNVTIPNTAANLQIGNFHTGVTPFSNTIHAFAIIKKALTAQDISQLYQELMSERYPLRAYSFGSRISAPKDPPGCPALLKTDFTTRLADGRLADLSGNGWHGTVKPGFVAGPGMCGNALMASSTTRSYVDFGDVTPINGATKLSIISYSTRGGSSIQILCNKGVDATHRNDLSDTTTVIRWAIGNEAAFANDVNFNVPRVTGWVFDGEAAAKARLHVDNTIPALAANVTATALPDSTGTAFQVGRLAWADSYSPPPKTDFLAVYPASLTPEQVGYVYKQIARRSTFALDMQRVPVSLANLVGPCEVPNTPFRLQSGGTWKVSEDAAGKRWFESVAGTYNPIYTPSTQAYGTWVYRIKTGSSGTDFIVPISDKVAFNTSPRSAYAISFGASNKISLVYYYTGGSTILFTSSTTYAASTEYDVAVTRSSSGAFSVYLRGGAYATWTLLAVESGTNPVVENTYKSCAYSLCVSASGATGAKFSQPRFFAGNLTIDQLTGLCP